MKVTIEETTSREVTLTKKQMNEIAINVLEKKFDLKHKDKVLDRELYREVEYQGHRTFWSWETQREAKESDIHVLRLIKELFNEK